jgi:hypothetical protein
MQPVYPNNWPITFMGQTMVFMAVTKGELKLTATSVESCETVGMLGQKNYGNVAGVLPTAWRASIDLTTVPFYKTTTAGANVRQIAARSRVVGKGVGLLGIRPPLQHRALRPPLGLRVHLTWSV